MALATTMGFASESISCNEGGAAGGAVMSSFLRLTARACTRSGLLGRLPKNAGRPTGCRQAKAPAFYTPCAGGPKGMPLATSGAPFYGPRASPSACPGSPCPQPAQH
jgi:hypothetical protein